MMKLCSTFIGLCKEVSVNPEVILHATAYSTVDPYFIITFGQNRVHAVIVAETLPYQIIQEISQARGEKPVCSRDCLR